MAPIRNSFKSLMNLETGNLLDGSGELPARSEQSTILFATPAVRIARIVSGRYSSPEEFWYDQEEDEWVAVIEGEATIAFADRSTHMLKAGDWLVIPAHTRHRIEKTSEWTIWLAVHMGVVKRASDG
jgi:cupin 2 domain-containing protein